MKCSCQETINRIFQKRWVVIISWQVLSLILCMANLFNTLLANRFNGTLPFFQLALNYTLLIILHTWRMHKAETSWIKYIILAIFNVGGDIFAIYAYNTTSLSSAMLLSTTVIFWVAPLSCLILHQCISFLQFISILVGMTGVVLVFIADGAGNSRWEGNLLALSSAICYAIANVMQEFLLKKEDVTTCLCRLSITLSPICSICAGIIEWKSIRDYKWNFQSVGYVIGYVILLSSYVSLIPIVLQFSSATEMNISLLTSNFYSLIISIIWFYQKFSWLYLFGFLCIPLAITIFSLFPPKIKKEETSNNEQYLLEGENSDKYT